MYGLGYIPSPSGFRGDGHPLFGVIGDAIEDYPENRIIPYGPILDQGLDALTGPDAPYQTCTANAASLLFQAEMGTGGDAPSFQELPSRAHLFTLGQHYANIPVNPEQGSYLYSLMAAAKNVGFPRESQRPYTRENLSGLPTWADDDAAYAQKVLTAAQRLMSLPGDRTLDLLRALAPLDGSRGSGLVWGTQVDRAFLDWPAGKVWHGLDGNPSVGGHAMCIMGYRRYGRDVDFLVPSSWGDTWCENGTCWVSSRAIESVNAQDFWKVSTLKGY